MNGHIIVTMIALIIFLIAAIWFARKKYKINLSVLGLGAIAFFVSAQVLEKIVHLLVLRRILPRTRNLLVGTPDCQGCSFRLASPRHRGGDRSLVRRSDPT